MNYCDVLLILIEPRLQFFAEFVNHFKPRWGLILESKFFSDAVVEDSNVVTHFHGTPAMSDNKKALQQSSILNRKY